ncbi:hypothetical protein IW152_003288 [Coemansia sp. BCRC 34962]|nr:hypothetical protein IW152_003288 [Coemansia sp. BCRC 34962]
MLLITVAVFASVRHPNQWNSQRYWIQTSMAPVLGIVVFLPLVMAVIVQILWRGSAAIDSALVSDDAGDGRGLFSQSIHNVHRWAWSKLGINSTHSLPVEEPRPALRSYYEGFKRSFVLNIVRRLFLTTEYEIRGDLLPLDLQIPRSISVKRRHTGSPSGSIKCRDLPTLDIYSSQEGPFSEYSDESARIMEIETVERLVSLEDGHWTKAVEKCRDSRNKHTAFASDNPAAIIPQTTPSNRCISRMYVYPLAYLLVWLPSVAYSVLSTYVYFTGFQSNGGIHVRSLDMSRLPAHWTPGQNMNRMWPYYQRLTEGIWGSEQLGWLAILQSLHMLSGAFDALLFWLTE